MLSEALYTPCHHKSLGLYMSIHQEREYLLERAKRFYETACMQMDKGFFDLAAFSLEQSIQLHLKACL
ncbi:MAG: HEPN domain-containing protein [Candidatus Bathyarchaeia archaeon]